MNNSSFPFSFWKGILFPIGFLIIITPWLNKIDLKTSAFFYKNSQFTSNTFWDALYNYGIWPAWIVIIIAIGGLCLSVFRSYRKYLFPSLYLILTLGIGSGFMIHFVLKENWGRPRPKQTLEYGGAQPFLPYYQPNFLQTSEPSKSFSCGHCSMGFYFFAVALVGRANKSRKLYWLGIAIALILGSLLSLTRIIQGGHFFSDTLVSALIMWLTAWILARYLLFKTN